MERRLSQNEQFRVNQIRAELSAITGIPISSTIQEIQSQVVSFQEERPLIKEFNNPIRMAEWLEEETHELLDEMQWGEKEPTEEEIQRCRLELADVVIFSLNIAQGLGIDLEQAIRDKMARNEERFPKELFQDPDGDFREIYQRRKEELGERHPDGSRLKQFLTPSGIPYGIVQEGNEWRKRFGIPTS